VRILLLTQFFDPEPASIPGMPLARWLHQRGHEVEVVTGFPNYPGGRFYPGCKPAPWRREVIDGVRVNRVILFPSHDRSGLGRAANYGSFALSAATLGTALRGRADAVYVYHPPATVAVPALLWKYTQGMPFVYHVQDLWPESVIESGMVGDSHVRRAVEWALSRWCGLVYRSASRIAVLSPGFKRILTMRGVPEDKIEVVPNWVDETVFKPMAPDQRLAQELGMAGRFNLVYSGNVGHFQGLGTAIRAAARLRHLTQFRLVLIGTGLAEQELRTLAHNLGADNVRFLGRRPYTEMGPITALASALLISLQDRPFFAATIPGKTQVALACGRPVLMSVQGDAADLITKAEAGVVCRPGDDAALAAAMERMCLTSRTELEAMGARGRDYYVRELSLDRGAKRLESILKAAARER
jgi:glycosyltransferase involved in cell wall biosynthesis